MSEKLSYCGFRCDLCPAYNQNIGILCDRSYVSKGWKRLFGFNVGIEDINCVGCKSEGKHADTECPVRPCITQRHLNSCAECDEYICEKLRTRTKFIEQVKEKHDNKFSDEEYELFIRPYEGKKRLEKIRKKEESK
jgi:hypothetical protein